MEELDSKLQTLLKTDVSGLSLIFSHTFCIKEIALSATPALNILAGNAAEY
jgi:hypothetical protein